ncbi:hypothetical protein LR48_Vigan01g191300 [Vigna angularis]|uniref:Uncharacterized protein n=1 Tax=Phaseolus angularis TaxID=3914 RepID=A0A0L9TPF7_PHAAN|nr:hypothetical protein LR48_Vigan01g191300 [Vigna angularis]
MNVPKPHVLHQESQSKVEHPNKNLTERFTQYGYRTVELKRKRISSFSASSKRSSPSAHIHTDDHCNDKTDVQAQWTTQGKRKASVFVHPGDVVTATLISCHPSSNPSTIWTNALLKAEHHLDERSLERTLAVKDERSLSGMTNARQTLFGRASRTKTNERGRSFRNERSTVGTNVQFVLIWTNVQLKTKLDERDSAESQWLVRIRPLLPPVILLCLHSLHSISVSPFLLPSSFQLSSFLSAFPPSILSSCSFLYVPSHFSFPFLMQQAAAATPKLGLSRLEGEVDHHLAHGSRKVQPAKRRNVPCTTASSMLPAARWASRFQLYRPPSSRSPATIGHSKQHTTNTSRKGAVQHLETAVGPGRESMARPWEKNAT